MSVNTVHSDTLTEFWCLCEIHMTTTDSCSEIVYHSVLFVKDRCQRSLRNSQILFYLLLYMILFFSLMCLWFYVKRKSVSFSSLSVCTPGCRRDRFKWNVNVILQICVFIFMECFYCTGMWEVEEVITVRVNEWVEHFKWQILTSLIHVYYQSIFFSFNFFRIISLKSGNFSNVWFQKNFFF